MPLSRGWLRQARKGFTLVEVMVSTLLIGMVIILAWTGLISVLGVSNMAQAKTARKAELMRAQDIIINEIREAQSINQSGSLVVDGNSVSMTNVVTNAGIALNDLGNYGNIALYLEIPTNPAITSCSTETGTVPADSVERIVYDIRSSPSEWLKPKAIGRYGRIPELDGSINPCSTPIANDIIADAIADTSSPSSCKGVLSGGDGFTTCTEGSAVELFFKSQIRDVEVAPMISTVTPRTVDFQPPRTCESLDDATLKSLVDENPTIEPKTFGTLTCEQVKQYGTPDGNNDNWDWGNNHD
ncbi:MAG: prepilin-type N-terminal cleavage/methylation domain-containing protein [Thermosynechococcaceae cyanobacterium]